MPINKNALLRYQILDRCFSDRHRRYEIEDLVDKVNDALLDMYGKTVLLSTIDMLGRYRSPKNAWLEEVISSLELRFGIKANRDKIVSFEQNDQLKGIEFLSDLIDAIINHQPLKMTYRPYKGDEQTMVIHPHYLKQYNSRWFLFGLEDHGEYGMSPVNKALEFSIAKVRFEENDMIDYETYFDDIVGVTHDRKHPDVEHVVMRFSKERFPYVVSKPIHHSQQVVNSDEGIISIDVRINRELEQNIFSFGQQVEVLSPEWFRNQIIEKYKEIVKIYGV